MTKFNIKEEIGKFNIIDSHMHLGVGANTLYYDYNDDRIIEIQKKFNVKTSICSHTVGICGDLDAQIEEIQKLDKKFKNFIYWQLVYLGDNPKKSLEIIEKYKDQLCFAGVKIYTVGSSLGLDSKKYYPLWDYASSNDIVVAAHTWSPYTENPKQKFGNPLLLKSVLKDFPKQKILLIHSGGKIDFYDEVINFAKKFNTVYLDFSGDCFHPPVFKKVINSIGNERSLFGTDMPMMDIRYHLSNVLVADISDEQKEDIFFNNAKKLFKLP